MPDGIAKGIGEQLGNLGKQIVTDIAKTPAKIAGMDVTGPNETVGTGSGKSKKAAPQIKPQTAKTEESVNPLDVLRQNDEVEKQKQLAQARRLLQQFIEPIKQEEPSIREKLEMEEMEKRKKEIEEEKKKAQKELPKVATKRPAGDLFGRKSKQFGGEVGKNVKSQ